MPRDKFDTWFNEGMARLDAEDSSAVDVWQGAVPVSGIEGMLYGADIPETIQEMGEAAHRTQREGLPVIGALAGAAYGGVPGEAVGAGIGEILGAVTTGERPTVAGVTTAAALPGVGRLIARPIRALGRAIGKYTPGYGLTTHQAAEEGLTRIGESIGPTIDEVTQLYRNPALTGARIDLNVRALGTQAREIYESQLAKPVERRVAASLRASRGVLKSLGYRLGKAGEVIEEGAETLGLNELRDLMTDVWRLKGPARAAGQHVGQIKQLYRTAWDSLRAAEGVGGLAEDAVRALRDANAAQYLNWGRDEFIEQAAKAVSRAGEKGMPFKSVNINGLMDRLERSAEFRRFVGEDSFGKIMGKLADILPANVDSAVNNYWLALSGRAGAGAALGGAGGFLATGDPRAAGMGGGLGALGALGGTAVGAGFGRFSRTPLGKTIVRWLAEGIPNWPRGQSVGSVLAQLWGVDQEAVADEGLDRADRPPQTPEDLEEVFGFNRREEEI